MKSNLVGMRFGRLLVTAQTDSKHNRTRWVCVCDCGKTCISTSRALQHDNRKSCGCLRIDMAKDKRRDPRMDTSLPEGEAAFNVLYGIYSRNAYDRSLTFELSKDQFRKLTKQNCFYCDSAPTRVFTNSGLCKSKYICNGIDRKDNHIGYVITNCVTCCKACNQMKSNLSFSEFISRCNIIVENFKRLAEMTNPRETTSNI
jgi:hypothetical protein